MADTMTGKTMTFAELEKDLISREQQQSTTTPAETTASTNGADPANTPAAAPASETTPPAETKQDTSVSNFDLSFGDEAQENGTTTTTQPQQPIFNLDEELKRLDPKEVLKKLGVSDFALEIDQHIKSGGQPIDYLQARAIDYNKISDDSLLKDDLRKQYPTLSPQQIDLMFNRKYIVSEDAPDEDKEFLLAQKTADAYKVRQSAISEQQKFKIADTPIPQKDEAYEQYKQYIDQEAHRNKAMSDFYINHPATKALNESKRVVVNLGDGVAPFNFVIDKPEMLVKPFIDDGTIWSRLTSTPQGEPDVAKQQLIALISYNPQKFIQDIFNYGKSMGVQKELVDEGRNAQKPQGIVTKMTNESNKAVPLGTGRFGDKAR